MKSKVELIGTKKKGYLLVVSDEHTSNQWAVTKEELVLIYALIKKRIRYMTPDTLMLWSFSILAFSMALCGLTAIVIFILTLIKNFRDLL